jgi:alpha-tubulin suppressor-like RCC1 family protein
VQLGELYACATRTDHTLWCWGSAGYGELGLGRTGDKWTPTEVGTDTDWRDVTASGYHTCATRLNGALWCWGSNAFGALGIGQIKHDFSTPMRVGDDTDWASVSAGYYHTCGTRTDGTIWCWGGNQYGQLGLGHALVSGDPARCGSCKAKPMQVGSRTDWTSLVAGALHTCATRVDHTLWCWGYNGEGGLGLGDTDDRHFPVQVGVDTDWASLALGGFHTCATRTDGTLWCWGWNRYGQLGVRDTVNRLTPTQVGAGNLWSQLGAGSIHTCATRTNHTLWCWGEGTDLQPHRV